MGVQVGVVVEDVEKVPVETRTDCKGLPDIIEDWLEEDVLELIGVNPDQVAPLRRVHPGAYADVGVEAGYTTHEQVEREKAEAWQSPGQPREALLALRAAIVRLQADSPRTRSIRRRLLEDGGNIWKEYLKELPYYDVEVQDAIAVCDWAETQGKQVALMAW